MVGQLKSSNKKTVAFSNARRKLAPALYPAVLQWIEATSYARNVVCPAQFPEEPRKLQQFHPPAPMNLTKEFMWAGVYLANHKEKLRAYARYGNRIRSTLFAGDHNECEKSLEELQRSLGYSLWLLKTRIAFLQQAKGLDAQKEFVANLRSAARPGSIASFVAYYVSVRNEPTTTAERFRTDLSRTIGRASIEDPLKQFLRFHIIAEPIMSVEEMKAVLAHGMSGAVIDYYESFLAASRSAIASNLQYVFPHIGKALATLSDVLDDERLTAIQFALGERIENPKAKGTVLLSGEFLRGQLREGALSKYLEMNPDSFEAVILLARCRGLDSQTPSGAQQTIRRTVLELLSAIEQRTAPISDIVDKLLKLGMNNRGAAWADALLGVTSDATSPLPSSYGVRVTHWAATGLMPTDPFRVRWYPTPETQATFVRALTSLSDAAPLVAEYASAVATGGSTFAGIAHLSPHERSLLQAELAFRRGDHDEAVLYSEKAALAPDAWRKNRALQLRAYSLLRAGRTGDCLRIVVSSCVTNIERRWLLPVEELADQIGDVTSSPLRNQLGPSILLDICALHVDPEYDGRRKDACEEFLAVQGLDRPSELGDHASHFRREELVYFLRYVCTQAVLDTSLLFKSSEEVALERVAICKVLTKMDRGNTQIYQDEIKGILRGLNMRKRMRQVEESRIFVDVEGIRRSAKVSLKESYSRYIGFVQHGLVHTDPKSFSAAVEASSQGVLSGLQSLSLPKSEPNDLLTRMINEVRDLYTVSPEHGLERYLSTRVRHGTLTGQVRSPLREAHLVTQRDSASGVYEKNAYWLNRLGADNSEAIATRFGQFSRDFDALVDEILKQWLRVRVSPEGTGIFDFVIPDSFVRVYTEVIVADGVDLDGFVDRLLATLTQILDHQLEHVRTRLEQDAKARASALLTAFQRDIHRLTKQTTLTAFDQAVGSARTGIQQAFDRISDWFQLWKESAREPYSWEEAIRVAETSVQALHPSFRVDIHSSHPDHLWHDEGNQFASLVDIFVTAFSNVVQHSLMDTPIATVTLRFDNDRLVVLIENAADMSRIDAVRKATVDSIRAGLSNEADRTAVIREGGTGLHKISRILLHDFTPEPNLEFGFADVDKFFLRFLLPAQLSTSK